MGEDMNQPKLKLDAEICEFVEGYFWCIDIIYSFGDGYISTARTKKTAYKRAADKLRELADEAERLAEKS